MDFATNTNKDIDRQSTDQYSTEEIKQKINAQSKQFSFQGLLPKFQKKLTALPLDHEGICTTVFPGQKLSPKGDAYRNGSAITNQNQNRIFLACSKTGGWENLDQIDHLVNQKVTFNITENGLKLKPLRQQPFSTQQHIADCIRSSEAKVNQQKKNSDDSKSEEKNKITASIEIIEKIAGSLTQKAAETGLPLALGVFIPPNLFSKGKNN